MTENAPPSTSRPVKGHALVSEGAPHDCQGARIRNVVYGWGSTDGPGHAKCECGELSEHLPSRRLRRQWHREHKAQVTA